MNESIDSFESSLNNLSPEEFERVMKYGNPSDKLGEHKSKAFTELPYGVVRKDFPNLMKQGLLTDAIVLILKCQFEDVNLENISGNEMLSFLLWARQQDEFINNLEKTYLSSDPDPDMLAAGINRLNDFGVLTIIDDLANGNILKYEDIESLPYFKVYDKLKLNKVKGEINKRYSKIMEEKAKTKKI